MYELGKPVKEPLIVNGPIFSEFYATAIRIPAISRAPMFITLRCRSLETEIKDLVRIVALAVPILQSTLDAIQHFAAHKVLTNSLLAVVA